LESLNLECFFTTPYNSYERGLNEYTKGFIREFYPKSISLKIVREENFQKVVDLINHRPRKSLDYRTPYELFYSQSEKPVALQI
jgi:transposase, IS30 family